MLYSIVLLSLICAISHSYAPIVDELQHFVETNSTFAQELDNAFSQQRLRDNTKNQAYVCFTVHVQ